VGISQKVFFIMNYIIKNQIIVKILLKMINWALPSSLLLSYTIILSLILGYTTQASNANKDNDIDKTKDHLNVVRILSIVLFVLILGDTCFNVYRHVTDRKSKKKHTMKQIHIMLSVISVCVAIITLVLSSVALNNVDNQEKVQQSTTGILVTIGIFFVLCFVQKIVYFGMFKQEKEKTVITHHSYTQPQVQYVNSKNSFRSVLDTGLQFSGKLNENGSPFNRFKNEEDEEDEYVSNQDEEDEENNKNEYVPNQDEDEFSNNKNAIKLHQLKQAIKQAIKENNFKG
jgi:NADH:ubiquinone oxidoreductase subunit 6 (subunit J)